MGEKVVKIKGNSQELVLEFAKKASFTDIINDIVNKLESGSGFFLRGTLVRMPRNRFSNEERSKLQKLFHEYGLICRLIKEDVAVETAKPVYSRDNKDIGAPDNSVEQTIPANQMLVIDRTLRGGEEVQTEQSVLVFGNVNPGAQIIAGGSIDIRGICRGMVHAGASGDSSAFIIADKLMPTQIRIADKVARPPEEAEITGKPERAFIKDGQIVIATID